MNPLFLPAVHWQQACLLFTVALRNQLHLVVGFVSVSSRFVFACTLRVAQESVMLVRLYSALALASLFYPSSCPDGGRPSAAWVMLWHSRSSHSSEITGSFAYSGFGRQVPFQE